MNPDVNFNPSQAIKAQSQYCETHECPEFAPYDGLCPMCGRNIYLPTNGDYGDVRGITVEKAGSTLVTGCPHCHYSFVE